MQRKSRKNAGRGEKASRSRSRSKKIHCNNSHPRYFLKNDILKTMNSNAVESAIKQGENLANKINLAKTTTQLDILYKEVENYTNFINNEFGIIDDFSEKNEKYCELSFYAYMAANEKSDNLEYYNTHPEETASGVEDFLDYLESMKWLV